MLAASYLFFEHRVPSKQILVSTEKASRRWSFWSTPGPLEGTMVSPAHSLSLFLCLCSMCLLFSHRIELFEPHRASGGHRRSGRPTQIQWAQSPLPSTPGVTTSAVAMASGGAAHWNVVHRSGSKPSKREMPIDDEAISGWETNRLSFPPEIGML